MQKKSRLNLFSVADKKGGRGKKKEEMEKKTHGRGGGLSQSVFPSAKKCPKKFFPRKKKITQKMGNREKKNPTQKARWGGETLFLPSGGAKREPKKRPKFQMKKNRGGTRKKKKGKKSEKF